MSEPLRIVALLAPRFSGATALAAALSRAALDDALPAGVVMPTDGAWFGRFRDGVSIHPELIELSGARRGASPGAGTGDQDDATSVGRPTGPVVRRGGRSDDLQARPAQSRQVVRDRLRRVASDARGAGARTLLFVAPGAAWGAEPAGLRRELEGMADEVSIALLVRRPEAAVAAAHAARVRLAEQTGERALTARAALATPGVVDELRFAELLARWADPDGSAATLVPATDDPASGVAALWASLGVRAAGARERPANGPVAETPLTGTPDSSSVGEVVPPLDRADLERLAALATRRARWAVTARARARLDTELDALRDATDTRALSGGDPFAFDAAEARPIARKFRRDGEAVRAAVARQWPTGVPDNAEHGALRRAWMAWFAGSAPR